MNEETENAPQTARAKFVCQSVTDHGYGKTAKLTAVGDGGIPENARFSTATPSGNIEITVNNPVLLDFYKPRKSYYIDFVEAAE